MDLQKKEVKKNVTFRLEPDCLDKLKKIADLNNVNTSYIIQQLIYDFLKNHKSS